MVISIRNLVSEDVLAGSTSGAELLPRLINEVAQAKSEVILLDFAEIRAATGSFLREAVLGFRDFCRRSENGLIPVVANANPIISEELNELLIRKADAVVVCDLRSPDKVSSPRVLGSLEQAQRLALELVIQHGEADATMLAATDQIGITAWNNRLAALAAKGILAETRSGRTKKYRPVLENLGYGS